MFRVLSCLRCCTATRRSTPTRASSVRGGCLGAHAGDEPTRVPAGKNTDAEIFRMIRDEGFDPREKPGYKNHFPAKIRVLTMPHRGPQGARAEGAAVCRAGVGRCPQSHHQAADQGPRGAPVGPRGARAPVVHRRSVRAAAVQSLYGRRLTDGLLRAEQGLPDPRRRRAVALPVPVRGAHVRRLRVVALRAHMHVRRNRAFNSAMLETVTHLLSDEETRSLKARPPRPSRAQPARHRRSLTCWLTGRPARRKSSWKWTRTATAR